MLGGVGEQSGLHCVGRALSSFASEGEEFERRTGTATKKNLRFETKKVEHRNRPVGTIDTAGLSLPRL